MLGVQQPEGEFPRVAGLLRNEPRDVRPAGFFVAVQAEPGDDPQRPIAGGFSHIDGGFLIRLDDHAQAALHRSGKVHIAARRRPGGPDNSVRPRLRHLASPLEGNDRSRISDVPGARLVQS